jgi:hypothetical protein
MSVFHFILTVALFVLLTPGILLRLPSSGSKWTVALVHGVVFAVVMHILYFYVLPNLSLEGFKEGKEGPNNCNKGSEWKNGKCTSCMNNPGGKCKK